MMEVPISELKHAVESQHGCKASVFQSVPIKETFGSKTAWEGIVYILSLTGHPTAKRAYAWSSPIEGSNKQRLFAVLHVPPICGGSDAISRRLTVMLCDIVRLTAPIATLDEMQLLPVRPPHERLC